MLRTIRPTFMINDIFINNLIANIICNLISLCIFRFTYPEKLINLYKQEMPKVNIFSINLLIYTLVAKWMWNFKREIFLEEAILFLIVPAIFILGNMIFFTHQIKESEFRKSLEEYKKYSLVISELLSDVRIRQHDFKNHLNTIYGLIQISDEKNLKEEVYQYMNSINTSLENIDNVLQIDNKVVTAIIYNKINEAAKSRIEFSYAIDSNSRKLPFKDYELSEVLNNLLDNAFEAVINPDKGFKKVFLNIGYLEDSCALEIGNTGKRIELNNISKIFDMGYTTKKGDEHGYGLYNVKKIVESYGGRIQLSFENNYTIFRVMLD
jgi:sensor histidine kinase regulating citrate/malate metabolism